MRKVFVLGDYPDEAEFLRILLSGDQPVVIASEANIQAALRVAVNESAEIVIFKPNPAEASQTSDQVTVESVEHKPGVLFEAIPTSPTVVPPPRSANQLPADLFFQEFSAQSNDVFWIFNAATLRTEYISHGFEQIWGSPPDGILASGASHLDSVHEEDRDRMEAARQAQLRGEPTEEEYRIVRPDGSVRWIRERAFPISDQASKVHRIGGILSDITQRKHLEEHLLRAQKMEAVGRLAGGVAHDFNNMLTAIMGYSQIALNRIRQDDPVYKYLEEVRKAGQRAAQLTKHLLAFSRKQVVQPQLVDLNHIITDIERMLRRVIGEDVILDVKLEAASGCIRADRGQIDQVIMNLAVNARDAMPRGGNLTITTSNVELDPDFTENPSGIRHGKYVALTVIDTGVGMDQETMEKVFDPFFTTKEMGKGTGLGLSTVYGIVNQSCGWIRVESVLDCGTTFKIFFPNVEAPIQKERVAMETAPPRGTETILLVEDEPMVRNMASLLLRQQGYNVLEASDASQAIAVAQKQQGPIHLMVTDVVMPGMGGRELAEKISVSRPEVRVLYYSGHTDETLTLHGVPEGRSVPFLEKPLSEAELARKVREVLDSDAPG